MQTTLEPLLEQHFRDLTPRVYVYERFRDNKRPAKKTIQKDLPAFLAQEQTQHPNYATQDDIEDNLGILRAVLFYRTTPPINGYFLEHRVVQRYEPFYPTESLEEVEEYLHKKEYVETIRIDRVAEEVEKDYRKGALGVVGVTIYDDGLIETYKGDGQLPPTEPYQENDEEVSAFEQEFKLAKLFNGQEEAIDFLVKLQGKKCLRKGYEELANRFAQILREIQKQ
ncbi:MAG: hypothetical protein Q7R96_01405 [Nanoarchaeota archaeon]|nr:hypothetical protein [Nanoarchaeota archaeon]